LLKEGEPTSNGKSSNDTTDHDLIPVTWTGSDLNNDSDTEHDRPKDDGIFTTNSRDIGDWAGYQCSDKSTDRKLFGVQLQNGVRED
jgi:hypothetical protein